MYTKYLPGTLRVRKGRGIPWDWSDIVVSSHMGAGNQTWTLREQRVLLTTGHLSSPRDKLFCLPSVQWLEAQVIGRQGEGGYLTSSEAQGWSQAPQLFPPKVEATLLPSTPR